MAANQVTVATPGPAGAIGLVYEGLWVITTVYQVRDVVRYTDRNLYICNVQHTAASGNTPVLDSTTWSLFINADDAYQWATKVKHTQITDSIGNTGYSALHQAAKAQDWASKINGEVTNDADASLDPDGFSAKAYAIGGTGVTTTSGQGAAKQWATTTGGYVDTAEYSAKEYAIGTTVAVGSAKDWAVLPVDSVVTGSSYSALHHAAAAAASATASASSASSATASATSATASATAASGKTYAMVITFGS